MKLDEHCIPTCIATTDIIPHDLMLKALIHNKRVAMKHTSERKINFLIRSLLKRGKSHPCDGQNDIFVISVIDIETSSDLKSILVAPHCYLPIEDQSCVVINEANGQHQQQVVVDDVTLPDDRRADREWSSSSVDSFFCRCNIDTVFPEDNAAIQLGKFT